jgi:hypothetical protein
MAGSRTPLAGVVASFAYQNVHALRAARIGSAILSGCSHDQNFVFYYSIL